MEASGKIGSNGVQMSDKAEKPFETYMYIKNSLLLILPQIEMSKKNNSWGKGDGAQGCQTYHLHVQSVLKSGSLSFLHSSFPVQACNEFALRLLLILNVYMYLSYVLQLIPTSGYSLPMAG
jgi:hypothetical protein